MRNRYMEKAVSQTLHIKPSLLLPSYAEGLGKTLLHINIHFAKASARCFI